MGLYKPGLPEAIDDFQNKATPVRQIYSKEVDALVKKLMPSALEVFPPAQGIRRVAGSSVSSGKSMVRTVHNDYAREFEKIDASYPNMVLSKQRERQRELGTSEHMLINLWRPTLPMSKPCRDFPLCFCDPSTVKEDDLVVSESKTDKEGNTNVTVALKYSPDQKWYFYPDMTVDEVVVFKQFDQFASDPCGRMPVFHTSFEDPEGFKGMERRVSFEYRVGVLLK